MIGNKCILDKEQMNKITPGINFQYSTAYWN